MISICGEHNFQWILISWCKRTAVYFLVRCSCSGPV